MFLRIFQYELSVRGLTVNAKDIIIKQSFLILIQFITICYHEWQHIQDLYKIQIKGHPKFREINITMISIYINDQQVNKTCCVSPQIICLQLFELLHDMWDHTMDLTEGIMQQTSPHIA